MSCAERVEHAGRAERSERASRAGRATSVQGGGRRAELATLLESRGDAPVVADLHCHTNVSDCSEDVRTVLSKARARGITHLAVTDHDTTFGLADAFEAGREVGVEVIGGVEISAYDFERGRKAHVLGLGLPADSLAVAKLCEPLLEARRANTEWQVKRLRDAGYLVDETVLRRVSASSTALYKQHVMAAMTDGPYSSEAYRRLYRSLFKGDGICARDIVYVDARDAVEAIVKDGGLPVLAHPGQLDSYDLVPALVECGLAGIERFHHDHDEADRQRCARLAREYGLFTTGGSDYHGAFGCVPHPGFCVLRPGRDWGYDECG